MTTGPERFFFVHLQKTAGTALLRRLRHAMGRTAVYPDHADGDRFKRVIDVPHLCARWKERGHEVRVVTGHFPLCTVDLLGDSFTPLTLLREPVGRTLSFLRHQQQADADDANPPLEALYDDPFRFHGLIHNHMVKMLGTTVDEMPRGALTRLPVRRDHLERAKERVARMPVVGVQERFEEFCDALTGRYGWDLGPPVWANRTVIDGQPSTAFLARVRDDNSLDAELYDFARELVDRRLAASERDPTGRLHA